MINPKLCERHEFKYGFNYQKVGMMRPDQVIVLFCKHCAVIKTAVVKDPKR